MGHQLRRYSVQRLAGADEVAFEPAGQLSAVLDRPEPLTVGCPGPFTSRKWSCVVVPTVFVASKRPFSSILTAVWLRLCASELASFDSRPRVRTDGLERTDVVGG